MAPKYFTELSLQKIQLPPAGERVEFRDSLVTGLVLRVTHLGSKTWCLVYRRFDGKQQRMNLGHYPIVSLQQARTLAKDALFELAQGNDPAQMREKKIEEKIRAQNDLLTLEELSKSFIERHCKPNTRRWKATEQVFRNHINPEIGKLSAKDITRKDVNRLLDKLKETKRPHAANHTLIALRKMFNWAIERDELLYNPCIGVRKPVPTKERERVLMKDEIIEFWRTCEKVQYPYGPLCQLLLLTGQRRSEIANLKWDEIDFEGKVIRLGPEKTKAKRGHEIPLSDFAISIFQSIPHHTGPFVFTSTGGKRPVNGFGKVKTDFEKHFKSSNWRFHDLRRTAATGMAEMGVPPTTISRVLNHAEGGVTKIYNRHSYLSEKRQALNLWAQYVWSILHIEQDSPSNVVSLNREHDEKRK